MFRGGRRCRDGPNRPPVRGGLDDAGIITFSAAYQDWADAEVIYISGTDPFETKTVLFTSWMMGAASGSLPVMVRKSFLSDTMNAA